MSGIHVSEDTLSPTNNISSSIAQLRQKRENELARIRQNQQKRLKSILLTFLKNSFNKIISAKNLLIPQNLGTSRTNDNYEESEKDPIV